MSPGGGYVLYFDDKDDSWYAIKAGDGQKINLTSKLGVKFQSETDDRPEHPTPCGSAGWTEGDSQSDRCDIWDVKPDGSGGRMITNGIGRKEHIVFRYSRTEQPPPSAEPEEGGLRQRQADQPAVSSTRPIILSAVDEQTRASGLYRVIVSGTAEPTKLVMMDKNLGVPIKARDADVYVVTASRFEEFPNLWTSNGTFADMKKISDANPQQAQYNWGRSELIDYVNADGKHLKAILPSEDFDRRVSMLGCITSSRTTCTAIAPRRRQHRVLATPATATSSCSPTSCRPRRASALKRAAGSADRARQRFRRSRARRHPGT
jgi:hypothetical protein